MKSKINIILDQLTVVNTGIRGQCSNRRRVSIKRRGFEAHVIINAEVLW